MRDVFDDAMGVLKKEAHLFESFIHKRAKLEDATDMYTQFNEMKVRLIMCRADLTGQVRKGARPVSNQRSRDSCLHALIGPSARCDVSVCTSRRARY